MLSMTSAVNSEALFLARRFNSFINPACDDDADAAKAEMTRALETLDWIPKGTLLVGDRLYASHKFSAM